MWVIGDGVDIGADEYCNETSNYADFNNNGEGDGIVNMLDFAVLSKACLSYGPYSESDPNTYNWENNCDLEDNDIIDVNDLALFVDEWLWMTCTRMEELPVQMMSMGMGMQKSMFEGLATIAKNQWLQPSTAPKLTIEEQIEQLKEIIDFLEEIWFDEELQKEIDHQDWDDFMNKVYNSMEELKEKLQEQL